MSITLRAWPPAAFCCIVFAVVAYAQDLPASSSAAPPANLAYVEGGVDVVHEGLTEAADAPMLLLEGDVLRTRGGRAEVVFADGTLLHVDSDSEMEILAPERVRLVHGRVLVRVSAAVTSAYFVDTPGGTVKLESRGEYGITTEQRSGRLDLSVARGIAEIDDQRQRVAVRAGETASLGTPGDRVRLGPFNSARWDEFGVWSNERAHGFTSAASAAQLPYELRPYAPVLDHHGRWDYLAPHGYVWFPSVGVAWRPYFEGSWRLTRYGWTWQGRDRWAWPTHHYGRWGYSGVSWYWIPARVWGPAWVSWAFTASYVSWSPLGWDGRPALGSWPRVNRAGYPPHHDPWRAWTVIPRHAFRPRHLVRANAIDGNRLDDFARRSTVENVQPPAPPGFAVPRGSMRGAGGVGNLRSDAPRADRSGDVRRPQSIGPPATAGEPAPQTPGASRRTIDARAYTPTYQPPATGSAMPRNGVSTDARDDRPRSSIRYPRPVTDPPERVERPNATTPPQNDGPTRERARPIYGVPERQTQRPSGEESQGRGGAVDRGSRRGGEESARPQSQGESRRSAPAAQGGGMREQSGGGARERSGGAASGSSGSSSRGGRSESGGGSGGARRRQQ